MTTQYQAHAQEALQSRGVADRQPSRLRRWLASSLTLGMLTGSMMMAMPMQPAHAEANSCATPGKDGAVNASDVVNSYFPPTTNSQLAAGATSVTIGNYYTEGSNIPISEGDMLMVIQMQDATIDSSNTAAYGSGNAANNGRGQTSLNNTGTYEFVRATNSVPLTGGTLTFEGGGSGDGVVNTYSNFGPTVSQGRRTFQVIRVVQYASLTLNSNITVPDWDGQVGGVLALDIAGNMDFNGFTIDADNRGFRGGFVPNDPSNTSGANNGDYVLPGDTTEGSGKGEGIAGTPRYMWDGISAIDLGADQLPGGDAGRGAPGNAGGGGNAHNAGGGGGSNGGDGGTGGIGWEGAGGDLDGSRGLGAASPIAVPVGDRLIMGGGGGGGDVNNDDNGIRGGQGGGIVYIQADQFVGAGSITSNGSEGEIGEVVNAPDGAGGGGAGGTVALIAQAGNLSGVTVQARGGDGGNTTGDSGIEHGPGGGGGGGIVISTSPGGQVSSTDLAGGQGGQADSGAGIPHGAEDGENGIEGTLNPLSVPPIQPGANCFPALTVTKTEANPGTPGERTAPGTANYSITVTNTGIGGASGVQLTDILPSGFTYSSGATATFSGGAAGPTSPTNSGSASVPVFGDYTIPKDGSVTVDFTVNIDLGTAVGTYQNPAYATYLDPTRTNTDANRQVTASTVPLPAGNTTYASGSNAGNNTPGSNYDSASSTGEDVVIFDPPQDYGDAPDTYGTDATDDSGEGIGARHAIVSNLYIGLPPDAETDAATPLDGTGDGTDEDGVTVRAMTEGANIFLVSKDEISVTNDTGNEATLHGWIDFDKNGVFSSSEHASIAVPTGSVGVNPSTDLTWNSITVGASGNTYARFRLTTDNSITDSTPGGTASDGEVEDYEVAIAPAPPTQSGGSCSIPYSMVYSGHFPNRIDAIHVDSGAFVALTTSTLAGNTNSLASDHINNLVYYAENNSLYAWSPITDTHTTISSNFGGFIGGAIDLGSGGAAFYNGSLYLGTDVDGVNPSEVYRVDFVPSSAGLTIQSVTSLNLAGIMPTTDWGDLTIDENGLLLASGGGGVFWTYDLNNSTFTTLSSTVPGDQHQFAKDGMGRLWAIVYTPTMFVVQVEVTGSTIQPVGSTISVAPHDTNDGAECVIGESSIGDRIWADTDGDGVQDPGENGIGNVTVDLYWDIDGDGQIDPGDDPVLATQTTGSSGNYDFFDLIFGDYIVQVTDTNNVLTGYALTTTDSEQDVTLLAGIVDYNDADFGYLPPAVSTDPRLLLAKRITAINRGEADEQLFDTSYVNVGATDDEDNETNWPGAATPAANGGTVESYIAGIINGTDSGVTIRPGDEIEYTIPFLSNGDVAAQDVLICDRIPANTSFLSTAFNSSTPAAPGPDDRGIFISYNGSAVTLTNVNDGDEIPDTGSDDGVGGYYFPAGTDPSTVFPGLACNGTNDNGAIVVDVSSVPHATGDGTPTNAYGFIRFKVVVD